MGASIFFMRQRTSPGDISSSVEFPSLLLGASIFLMIYGIFYSIMGLGFLYQGLFPNLALTEMRLHGRPRAQTTDTESGQELSMDDLDRDKNENI